MCECGNSTIEVQTTAAAAAAVIVPAAADVIHVPAAAAAAAVPRCLAIRISTGSSTRVLCAFCSGGICLDWLSLQPIVLLLLLLLLLL
jgi:hypothetical protein